ncbi:hypothetical protein PNA2_0648 [Pyrococcus sp. NA2]|uniref:hypothetical protein n=1 Tax=Pyrococcus sp. (strain NA2) TaxID=342949 RepID=UPI000209ACA6|nr:hypothetical protein [Pyrococcus sp. NA2]AEC51564.1 hypothetical protein PNA2_0648 [Pyrococcus sp. NA2]
MIDKLKKVRDLHRKFESLIPEISNYSKESIFRAYELINEEIKELSEILDEGFKVGREFERIIQETFRLMLQMKGLVEEALANIDDRRKLEFPVRKILNFNRNFDFIVTENVNSLITYAEFMEILETGNIPSSLLDKINAIENFEERVNVLINFLRLLYNRPSDVFRVEFSLRMANQQGMRWVDVWYLKKETGLKEDEIREILDALTLIGVTEKRERGGESVYRVRDIRED